MENESIQSGRTLSVTPRSGATAPPKGEPRTGESPVGGGVHGGAGPSQAAAQTAPPKGEPSAEEKAKAFRALIRGEYKAQYAEETQKLINRRFRETEALKRRVAELEAGPSQSRPQAAATAPPKGEPRTGESPVGGGALGGAGTVETPQSPGGDSSPVRGAYGEGPAAADADAAAAADAADADAAAAAAADADAAAADAAAANTDCTNTADTDAAAEAAAEAAERRAHAFAASRSALWQAQAEALRAREPDFDLDRMRGDPTFALLLMHGVPLERAWRAATVTDRERAAAAEAERALAADIRARGFRPPEAGGAAAPAFSLRPDVNRLSDSEVRAVLARLAQREHISFG